MKKMLYLFLLWTCITIVYADEGIKNGELSYWLNTANQTAYVYNPAGSNTYGIPGSCFAHGDVVIPDAITYNGVVYRVTSINNETFAQCASINSVVIGNNVTHVEDKAFYSCSGLRSVTIGSSVSRIGKQAFYNSYKTANGLTLNEIILLPNTPPDLDERYDAQNAFTFAVPIYIPCGTLDAYMATKWAKYNIQYIPNVFEVNTMSSDPTKGTVDTTWISNNICQPIVSILANPTKGCHFVRWNDGKTDNPRKIELFQDTTFLADFAIDKSGSCGKNNLLSWIYDDKTKTLTISGKGELTENYFYGLEAPTQMQNLIIGDDVTAIGDSAFYAMTTIRHLSIGSGMTSIGNDAFAECKNFDDITCYATTVPTITVSTFANVGNKYYIYLFVPEECQRAYKRDIYWGAFDIRPIVEAANVETNDVKVTPTDSSVVIVWPVTSGAETYELIIKDKNGKIVCTLTFNANGMLIQIAFKAPAREQSTGFSFTVTGLENNTSYDLTITAKNGSGTTIDEKAISFTTTGSSTALNQVKNPQSEIKNQKIIKDSHLFILRDGKTYTVQGQEVK